MEEVKVVDWVDIEAPRQEVFDLILNIERRIQLSPLWGVSVIEGISPDYPQPGSHYRVRLIKGEQNRYDTIITELQPEQKISYKTTAVQETEVTWVVQEAASGTRVLYEEKFCIDPGQKEELTKAVRKVVHDWLANMKRYAELREKRWQRLVKWFLDRYYLKMRQDQRKVVQVVLFMQVVGLLSFVMAAVALGVSSLF